jgi:sulfotransferase family protein
LKQPQAPDTPGTASEKQELSPVFILSPTRSYSTVSLALLSGHPGVYGFPETLLLAAPTIGELIQRCKHGPIVRQLPKPDEQTPSSFRYSRLVGLARALAHLREGSLHDSAVECALEWLFSNQHWSTTDVMRYLFELASPQISVEKSPDISYSDQALQRCFSAFPRARYLHLTRHPVSTEHSMHAAWHPEPEDPKAKPTRARHIMNWYSCHRRIVRALDRLPHDRWRRVRAEDLLGSPRIWLPQILTWLRLECSDEILSQMMHTEKWPYLKDNIHPWICAGDWKFFADPVLRPVEAPEKCLTDPGWNISKDGRIRVAALARYLGY